MTKFRRRLSLTNLGGFLYVSISCYLQRTSTTYHFVEQLATAVPQLMGADRVEPAMNLSHSLQLEIQRARAHLVYLAEGEPVHPPSPPCRRDNNCPSHVSVATAVSWQPCSGTSHWISSITLSLGILNALACNRKPKRKARETLLMASNITVLLISPLGTFPAMGSTGKWNKGRISQLLHSQLLLGA